MIPHTNELVVDLFAGGGGASPVRIYEWEKLWRAGQVAEIVAEQLFYNSDHPDSYFSEGLRVIIKDPQGEITTWDVSFEPTVRVDAEEVKNA